jgi:hypothetical protein
MADLCCFRNVDTVTLPRGAAVAPSGSGMARPAADAPRVLGIVCLDTAAGAHGRLETAGIVTAWLAPGQSCQADDDAGVANAAGDLKVWSAGRRVGRFLEAKTAPAGAHAPVLVQLGIR